MDHDEISDTDCSMPSEPTSTTSKELKQKGSARTPKGHRVRKRKLTPSANDDEPPTKKSKFSSSRKGKKDHFLNAHSSESRAILRAFDRDRFDDELDEDFEDNPARKLVVTVLSPPSSNSNESNKSNGFNPSSTVWVRLDDILRSGLKYDSQSTPTPKETAKQFVDDVRLYLKRNAIEEPMDSFYTKMGSKQFVSEKGFCLFMLMMKDFDGGNVYVQHWASFRFYYRNKLFGTSFKGMSIKKPQSIEEMEICVVCNLEDVGSQFEYDNPCDCQCVVHKSCSKLTTPWTAYSEFCPLCSDHLPLDQLRARRKWAEETGDFEVEWVVDYDVTENEYIVKWKGYPTAAICKTVLAASFVGAVRSFWAKAENQPIPKLAQQGIDDLNAPQNDDVEEEDESQSDDDEKMAVDGMSDVKQDAGGHDRNHNDSAMNKAGDSTTDEMDSKMSSLDIDCAIKQQPQKLGAGIFIEVKLEDVMDSEYIIRRQKYTKETYLRMKSTQSKYRKWLQRQITNETPLGYELKHYIKAEGLEDRLPKYHLRSVNKGWDCDIPRIRDLILNFLSRDWDKWNHDISHPSVVVAEIIDPTNPAKKYGGDQGVHEHKAYGLFATKTIPKDTILFEYAGCVTSIGLASKKMSHLENELDQTTLFDLIGHLEADRAKLFWGKKANDQLVIDPSRWHNEGVYMNDYRDRVLEDPDDDVDEGEEVSVPNEDQDRVQNVKFHEVLVNNWPRVFAVAKMDIGAGKELLGDYGNDFWKNFRLMMKRQQQLQEIKDRIHGEWRLKYDALKRQNEELKAERPRGCRLQYDALKRQNEKLKAENERLKKSME